LFTEPKHASEVKKVLTVYEEQCKKGKGAALFCVAGELAAVHSMQEYGNVLTCILLTGGKMSEGINFADSMGRCVVVVGLPYANLQNPELKERVNFISTKFPVSRNLLSILYIYIMD
jgi:Rad3-related DNA helicase